MYLLIYHVCIYVLIVLNIRTRVVAITKHVQSLRVYDPITTISKGVTFRFSRNSEFLENLEDMFHRDYINA